MSNIGTIVSPSTGQRVLAVRQSTLEEKVWMARRESNTNPNKPLHRDILLMNMPMKGTVNDLVDRTSTLRKTTLRGEVGDVFNYVTLENYGKRTITPL